jgi:hypothetical protein
MTDAAINQRVSAAFRRGFEAHPARRTDLGLALCSARDDTARLVPTGRTGVFDDETLTFRVDPRPVQV